ncbi:MAG: hypothetical protein WBQ89_06060, partial [Candidatus Acidiferrum sp.]
QALDFRDAKRPVSRCGAFWHLTSPLELVQFAPNEVAPRESPISDTISDERVETSRVLSYDSLCVF